MDIRIPSLSEGVNSGTVVAIHVKVGDTVQKDQTLIELETEKAVAPIPSPSAGKVASIQVKEGDKVSVGQVIVSFEKNGGAPQAAPAVAPAAKTQASTPRAQAAAPRQQASAAAAPTASSASVDVRIPALSEGVNTGTVVAIHVKVGDAVKKDQTLIELETEKAVAPIPAAQEGVVEQILVKEGDKVTVGQPILKLKSGSASAASTSATQPKESSQNAKVLAQGNGDVPPGRGTSPQESYEYQSVGGFAPPASPYVRKMARELNIDLRRVRGTERGGRITVEDLKNYIQVLQQGPSQGAPSVAAAGAQAAGAQAAGDVPSGRGTSPQGVPQSPYASIDFSKWGAIRKEKMTTLRQTISNRMTESWTTIPHVTQFEEVDLTTLLALRKTIMPKAEKKGVKPTVTGLLLKAIVKTLQAHPKFNMSMDEVTREIVYKDYFHFGIAVDTDAGLIVPVIRDINKKDLFQLSKDLVDIAEKARTRKLSIEDLKGGTFTISNQGGIGGSYFTPIINKPEVAILGLGKSVEKPIVKDKKIEVGMMLPLALSYDHRVIDGGDAARFIAALKENIETLSEKDL